MAEVEVPLAGNPGPETREFILICVSAPNRIPISGDHIPAMAAEGSVGNAGDTPVPAGAGVWGGGKIEGGVGAGAGARVGWGAVS